MNGPFAEQLRMGMTQDYTHTYVKQFQAHHNPFAAIFI